MFTVGEMSASGCDEVVKFVDGVRMDVTETGTFKVCLNMATAHTAPG